MLKTNKRISLKQVFKREKQEFQCFLDLKTNPGSLCEPGFFVFPIRKICYTVFIMMQINPIKRYFFFTLLLITFVFVTLIFRPFLIVLALGAALSVVLHPVYEWLQRRRLPNWLAALLVVILFIIVLCGPLTGIGALVFNQSQNVYQSIIGGGNTTSFIDNIGVSINQYLPYGMGIDIHQRILDGIAFVSANFAHMFTQTLSVFFSFLLLLLTIFYFLKDGAMWREALIRLSPLADENDEKILRRLSRAVNGVFTGYLLIGLVQGVLMGIGLAIFGVPNPVLWGVVAAIASLVPTIGTSLVSAPMVIFLFATGHTGAAIGFLIWAIALVGTVDNLLNPIVVGSKIDVPPLLILFSVLGGVSLLGPVGILIGPLAMSLLYTLIAIYRTDFK